MTYSENVPESLTEVSEPIRFSKLGREAKLQKRALVPGSMEVFMDVAEAVDEECSSWLVQFWGAQMDLERNNPDVLEMTYNDFCQLPMNEENFDKLINAIINVMRKRTYELIMVKRSSESKEYLVGMHQVLQKFGELAKLLGYDFYPKDRIDGKKCDREIYDFETEQLIMANY